MTLADDQARILEALVRHRVRFVVVGGVAAQLRGWTGATVDLDIAIASEEGNTARINRALAELGLLKEPDIGALGTSFQTPYGRLEIVRRADGIGKYDDWMRNASEVQVDHLTIVVASTEDIVKSKESSNREKDRSVLPGMRVWTSAWQRLTSLGLPISIRWTQGSRRVGMLPGWLHTRQG